MIMNEIWKDVIGYEGYYQVSNIGNVRNSKLKILYKNITQDGYLKVKLFQLTIKKVFTIHRLVAIAFISNPKNKPTVNHKDGNKFNNNVNNLEWATRSENTIHAYKTGLYDMSKLKHYSSDNSNAKAVIQYTKKDNKFVNEYLTLTEAAKINKIDISDISKVCNKKKKSAGGYIWKFKNELV